MVYTFRKQVVLPVFLLSLLFVNFSRACPEYEEVPAEPARSTSLPEVLAASGAQPTRETPYEQYLQAHLDNYFNALVDSPVPETMWNSIHPLGTYYLTYHVASPDYRPADRDRMRRTFRQTALAAVEGRNLRQEWFLWSMVKAESQVYRGVLEEIKKLEKSLLDEKAKRRPQAQRMNQLERQIKKLSEYSEQLYLSLFAKYVEIQSSKGRFTNYPESVRREMTKDMVLLVSHWAKLNNVPVQPSLYRDANGNSQPSLQLEALPGGPLSHLANALSFHSPVPGFTSHENYRFVFVPPSVEMPAGNTYFDGSGNFNVPLPYLFAGRRDVLWTPELVQLARLISRGEQAAPMPFRGVIFPGAHLGGGTVTNRTLTFYANIGNAPVYRAAAAELESLPYHAAKRDLVYRLQQLVQGRIDEIPVEYSGAAWIDMASHLMLSGLIESKYDFSKWKVVATTLDDTKGVGRMALLQPSASVNVALAFREDSAGITGLQIVTDNFTYEVRITGEDLRKPFELLKPLLDKKGELEMTQEQKEAMVEILRTLRRNMDLVVSHTRNSAEGFQTLNKALLAYLKESSPHHERELVQALRDFKEPAVDKITSRTAVPRYRVGPIPNMEDRGVLGPPLQPKMAAEWQQTTEPATRRRVLERAGAEILTSFAEMQHWVPRDRQPDNSGYDFLLFDPATGRQKYVELKTVSSLDSTISLTSNEIEAARHFQKTGAWVLAVVYLAPDGTSRVFLQEDLNVGSSLPSSLSRPFLLRDILEHSTETSLPPAKMPDKNANWVF